MDLNNAEIAVTTQHLIDIKDYRDYWLHLSDYSDMGEFLSACSDLFPGEKEPEYRYPKWENIPDTLISREWLCPNFFEIRDALERLEEEETEFFISWSSHGRPAHDGIALPRPVRGHRHGNGRRYGYRRRCPDIHRCIKLLLRHASLPIRNI